MGDTREVLMLLAIVIITVIITSAEATVAIYYLPGWMLGTAATSSYRTLPVTLRGSCTDKFSPCYIDEEAGPAHPSGARCSPLLSLPPQPSQLASAGPGCAEGPVGAGAPTVRPTSFPPLRCGPRRPGPVRL